MQKGDIVYYRAASQAEIFNGMDVHCALITHVWNAQCLNLKVMPDCGAVFDKTSVQQAGIGWCAPGHFYPRPDDPAQVEARTLNAQAAGKTRNEEGR